MHFRGLFVSVLATGLLAHGLWAQGVFPTRFAFDNWQTEQGLSGNSALCLLQGKEGYIWIGTYEGLVRWDGAQFTLFPTNAVRAMTLDSAGTLWLGVQQIGVMQFRHDSLRVWPANAELPSVQIRAMYADSHNRIWIGTEAGVAYAQGDSVVQPPFQATVGRIACRSFLEVPSGGLYIGTSRGLAQVADVTRPTVRWFTQAEGLAGGMVFHLQQEADSLWVLQAKGLSLLKGGKVVPQPFDTREPMGGASYLHSLRDRTGRFWIATNRGLLLVAPGQAPVVFTEKDGLANSDLGAILEDHEGNLWLGTYRGGLCRVRRLPVHIPGADQPLAQGSVHAIVPAGAQGAVWVGGYGGIRLIQDYEVKQSLTEANGLMGPAVRALAVGPKGELWVGVYDRGVQRYANGQWKTWTRAEGLPADGVRVLATNPRTGTLWVGTARGLARVEGEAMTSYINLHHNSLVSLMVDSRERLWYGTDGGGVGLFDQGQFKAWGQNAQLPDTFVFALHEYPKGHYWMGTRRGLAYYHEPSGRVTQLVGPQGLPPVNVYQISHTADSTLWLGTAQGIIRLTWAEVQRFLNRPRGPFTLGYKLISKPEGMPVSGTSVPARGYSDGQNVWMPTPRGVVVVHAPWVAENLYAPIMRLEAISADGTPVSVTGTPVVPAGTQQITLRFTGMSYEHGPLARFEYRIDELDTNWVQAGTRREAIFTNLSPGSYTFRFRGANNDGHWSRPGGVIRFRVAPTVTQQWWFRLLMALLVAAGLYGFYRIRLRVVLARNEDLEQKVKERTQEIELRTDQLAAQRDHLNHTLEELQATQQQLVLSEKKAAMGQLISNLAHELNSPISAIKSSARLNLNLAREALPRLGQLARLLEPYELSLLLDALQSAVRQSAYAPLDLPLREERALVRQTADALRMAEIEIADQLAPNLVRSGLYQSWQSYLHLWNHPHAEEILHGIAAWTSLQRNAGIMQEAADRTARIIGTLKVYLQPETSGRRAPVHLEQQLENALLLYESQLPGGTEVIKDLPKVPAVQAVPDELELVWSHLLHNAILALAQTQGPRRLTIRAYHRADQVMAEVLDSGPGVPREVELRLFEPFITNRPTGQGIGLGLYLCRQVLEGYGGSINYERQGTETCFRVCLPLSA